jgi:hypothetical protein
MNNYIKKFVLFFCIPIILGHYSEIFSQMSNDVRNFLWEKDFKELITEYAEEEVILRDLGDFKKRLELRSFTETNGYRVQTFAGSNKENADKMVSRLVQLNLDSVYVLEETGLYKVQIGNFTERLQAEKMLDLLRFQEISNSWIVGTIIHVPKQPVIISDSISAVKKPPSYYFAIQLFVTKNEESAKIFSEKFTRDSGDPSRLIKNGEFWKVISGRYTLDSKARERLGEIRSSGYPDAWITQLNH